MWTRVIFLRECEVVNSLWGRHYFLFFIFLSQNCCPTLFLEWWGRQVKSQRRNWIIYLRRNHHGGFSFDWIIYLWSNCCGGLQLIDLYGGARLIRMFATWWWTTIRLRLPIWLFCWLGCFVAVVNMVFGNHTQIWKFSFPAFLVFEQ